MHPSVTAVQALVHFRADPKCNTLAQIDILLGSDLIPQIILECDEKLSNTLLAQNTIFGWILSGQLIETVFTLPTEDEYGIRRR